MRLNKVLPLRGQLEQSTPTIDHILHRQFTLKDQDDKLQLLATFSDRDIEPIYDLAVRYNGFEVVVEGRDSFEQTVFTINLTPELLRKVTTAWLTKV